MYGNYLSDRVRCLVEINVGMIFRRRRLILVAIIVFVVLVRTELSNRRNVKIPSIMSQLNFDHTHRTRHSAQLTNTSKSNNIQQKTSW